MVRKSNLCIIITSLVCALTIGLGIALIVLGTNQTQYYDEKFKQTVLNVINYVVKQEKCSLSLLSSYPYKGYAIFEYDVLYNNTLLTLKTNISDICGSSYEDVMKQEEKAYPTGFRMNAWYFIEDPSIWIRYRPRGEMYLIGGMCTGIVFLLSLMLLIVYICKRIRKHRQRLYY